MNLPNDVSRCIGRLDWDDAVCPHREGCQRYIQLIADLNMVPARYPMIMNCVVDGEYTMRIET